MAEIRHIVAVLVIFSTAIVIPGCIDPIDKPSPPLPPSQFEQTLIFNDEFNRKALKDTWDTCFVWAVDRPWDCTIVPNEEEQLYLPDNVSVENGALILEARQEQLGDYQYTSGMITSHAGFSFQYGYVEVRARFPAGQGFWPAFWLLPTDGSWPPEIDVLEINGQEPNTVIFSNHYLENGDHQSKSMPYAGPDFSADFHTFGVLWQPDKLTWYVDEIELYSTTVGVPSQPMFLVATLAVGGTWFGSPDSSTEFPGQYVIDYIRVWEVTNNP